MPPETLFSICNLVALLGWVLLIVAPRWRWTSASRERLIGPSPCPLAFIEVKFCRLSNPRDFGENYMMKKFAQLLEQKRKDAGLSISELAALSGLPESRLMELEGGIDRQLAQAKEDRELAAAQMDENWLGMRLLAWLRESPNLRTTELADKLGEPVDLVAPILARLMRFGVIEVHHRLFVCTERGSSLLRNLEAATGISLAP